jgi:hypothetical protein
MAKANIENTTSLTRRGAFALIAAAPVGAIPIVAVSSYPLFGATPDPIFAAIETYMHAKDAAFKACDESDNAEHQFTLKYGASTPDALSKEVREKLAPHRPRHCKIENRNSRADCEVLAGVLGRCDRGDASGVGFANRRL